VSVACVSDDQKFGGQLMGESEIRLWETNYRKFVSVFSLGNCIDEADKL